jgi:hypothetical protein
MPLRSGLLSGLLDGVLLISVYLVLLDTSEFHPPPIGRRDVSDTPIGGKESGRLSEARRRMRREFGADDRYGTQVNKALTSAMILWAICMSSVFHPHPSTKLTNSNHLPILHYHLHPTLIIRTSIKGIEVYRKQPILSLLLRESSLPTVLFLCPTLHRPLTLPLRTDSLFLPSRDSPHLSLCSS